MKKILCIGNSFSQDASRYVWGIARAAGEAVKIVNLYIGGCDLSRHYRNMLSENHAYAFEINGMTDTKIRISLKDALLQENWDVVTFQQQSLMGTDFETFNPYFGELAAYVRKMCPKARIWLLQTWGYEEGSKKLAATVFPTHKDMFDALKASYVKAKDEIGAYGIIPGGEAILRANERGGLMPYRDGYHMSYGFGRYLLGLMFFQALIGGDVESNSFRDFDGELSEDEVRIAKEIAQGAWKSYEN